MVKRCNSCKKEFKALKKQAYCSISCANLEKYKAKQIVISCLFCKKEIRTTLCFKEKKYCSRSCKDESQKETLKGDKNNNFGNHALKGISRTQDKISKIKIGALKSWKDNFERKRKHSEKMHSYKAKFGIYPMHSKESQEKAKETIARKIASGELEKRCRGINGHYTSIKTGIQEFYHSSWELLRMQELDNDSTVLFWTKKHKIVIKLPIKGKYIPDFLITYVNGEKKLEEVKGHVIDPEKFEKQILSAQEYCDKNNIIFVLNFMIHLRTYSAIKKIKKWLK